MVDPINALKLPFDGQSPSSSGTISFSLPNPHLLNWGSHGYMGTNTSQGWVTSPLKGLQSIYKHKGPKFNKWQSIDLICLYPTAKY